MESSRWLEFVFPTYVGVILYDYFFKIGMPSVPHVCGGDPKTTALDKALKEVFPTYVGVILSLVYRS